jgi:hypothetical protein
MGQRADIGLLHHVVISVLPEKTLQRGKPSVGPVEPHIYVDGEKEKRTAREP